MLLRVEPILRTEKGAEYLIAQAITDRLHSVR